MRTLWSQKTIKKNNSTEKCEILNRNILQIK